MRCRNVGRSLVGLWLLSLGAACGEKDAGAGDEPAVTALAAGSSVTFEAEGLARTASPAGSQVTSEAGASGGQYVQFKSTPMVGGWIEFTLPNVAADTYDLSFLYKSNDNRGTVQAVLDGANQGPLCNQYAAVATQQVPCALGRATLATGNHVLRFRVTGKDTRSTGTMIVVDQIALTAASGPGAGGAGGEGGAGGSPGAGGAGGAASLTRPGGACQTGASYPAPIFTATPKLVYKPTGTVPSGTFEGPAWLASDSTLRFSDLTFTGPINPSQLDKLAPPSTVSTTLASAGLNGMALDGAGVLYACSHKVQGIVRVNLGPSPTLTTVIDSIGGKKFNSPNDLVLRSDGTIYFTDPDFQLGNRVSATGKKGVYRVGPDRSVALVDGAFAEPNGIALSPDESVLYVADYNANVVRAFSVAADGTTSSRRDFASVSSPDGFGMDCLGNLYVASGTAGMMQVYAPSGAKLGSVRVATSISNLAFGGTDGKTLYITAGKALYSLAMNLPGFYD